MTDDGQTDGPTERSLESEVAFETNNDKRNNFPLRMCHGAQPKLLSHPFFKDFLEKSKLKRRKYSARLSGR